MNSQFKSILIASVLGMWSLVQSVYAQYDSSDAHQDGFEVNSYNTFMLDSLYLLNQQGNWIETHRLYEWSQSLDPSTFDKNDSIGYYLAVGGYCYKNGEIEKANSYYEAVAHIATQSDDNKLLGIVHIAFGNLHYYLKDISTAIEFYDLVTKNEDASSYSRAAAAHNTGALMYELFQSDSTGMNNPQKRNEIESYLRQAIQLHKENQNDIGLAATYSVIVPWFGLISNFDSAYSYAEQSIELSQSLMIPGRTAFAQINYARVLVWDGKPERAIARLDSAIAFYDSVKNLEQLAHGLRIKSWAYDSLGEYKKAFEAVRKVNEILREEWPEKLREKVAQNKAKNDYFKVESQNAQLELSNAKSRLVNQRLKFALILISIAVILIYLFYRNRIKSRELQLKLERLKHKDQIIKTTLEAEESERNRIAMELHDGVGQQLSSLMMRIEDSTFTDVERKENLKKLISSASFSIRSMSHKMMPFALKQFGLIQALKGLTENLNEQYEVQFSFEHFNIENVNLPEFTQSNLYRIAQEATNNILKHAQATEASIQLYKQAENLILAISDNGSGFDTSQNSKGMGLFSMMNRAEALDGSFHIESNAAGTNIIVKIPHH